LVVAAKSRNYQKGKNHRRFGYHLSPIDQAAIDFLNGEIFSGSGDRSKVVRVALRRMAAKQVRGYAAVAQAVAADPGPLTLVNQWLMPEDFAALATIGADCTELAQVSGGQFHSWAIRYAVRCLAKQMGMTRKEL